MYLLYKYIIYVILVIINIYIYKTNQELQEDITKYSEKVNDLNNQVRVFKEEEHFLCAELEEKESLIKERYDNLSEPCQVNKYYIYNPMSHVLTLHLIHR